MSSNKRVIIIGLDGATFDLIKPWAAEGKLPTFKRLMENGVYGDLRSTIPPATIPAWPSFATGCNPGKHSFYDFFKEKEDGYEMTVEMQPSKAIKQPTLWKILGQHGKLVAVVNVPSTFPPTKVNGYMVTGMLTPPGARYTYPPEFEKEIKSNVGDYNVFFSALSAKNPEVLLNDLEETLEARTRLVEYLWKEKNPDFLMMVDNGTDRAEHELWRFLDPHNPLHSEEEVNRYGNPLLKYYQIVDNFLERIEDLIDDDTILMLMSDHGQGTLRKFVNLNIFLIEEGFMKVKRSLASKVRFWLFNNGLTPQNLYNLLRKLGVERFASDRVSQQTKLSLLSKFFFSTSDIDWSNTYAFASGVTGAITINLEGRQPQGIVKSEDYENVRNKIMDRLFELKDTETDEKVIKNAFKREDVYEGPYVDKAPDIVAIPNDSYEFFGMYGFTFNKMIIPTFGNSGSHRSNGIFMAVGDGLKEGEEIEGANIVDVASTVLHVMGLSVPGNMDGRVLEEIFEENGEFDIEARFKESEREKISKRIKSMGW